MSGNSRGRAVTGYMNIPPLLLAQLKDIMESIRAGEEVPSLQAGVLEKVGLAVWAGRAHVWATDDLGDMRWAPDPTEEAPDCGYFCWQDQALPDACAQLLQWLLLQLPEVDLKYITVECAYTCDILEPASCGGSATFITRKDVLSMGTAHWLRRKAEEHKDGPVS